MSAEEEQDTEEGAEMLELKNIKKSFNGDIIFDDLSLAIERNKLTLITGESGCGKTTLLRIIAGLDKDFSGEISGLEPSECAFSFQEYRLFPSLNAFENVYLVTNGDKEKRKEIAENALLELGFSREDLSKFPDELSGGMKQRVALARVFVSDKSVLLLDEPTKELDAELIKILYKKIKSRLNSATVIMVTHMVEDIKEFSDCVIELKK